MAVTEAQANPTPESSVPASTSGRRGKAITTLDDDVSMPGVVEPGDAPFDTVDPLERASSTTPDKGAAAKAGFGTVNAVVPLPPVETPKVERGEDRIESYEVTGPNGKLVKVTHNIDTGETKTG